MEIKEEDIFKYVLFPDTLASDKKEIISANANLFSEQINFCKAFLGISTSSNDIDLGKNAADRILSKIKVIELLPVESKFISKENSPLLAAATIEFADKKSESITYIDEESKYLIRLLNNDNKNTLFFFSKSEKEVRKFKLTLLPSNKSYHISSPTQMIEIDYTQTVERILIEEE